MLAVRQLMRDVHLPLVPLDHELHCLGPTFDHLVFLHFCCWKLSASRLAYPP